MDNNNNNKYVWLLVLEEVGPWEDSMNDTEYYLFNTKADAHDFVLKTIEGKYEIEDPDIEDCPSDHYHRLILRDGEEAHSERLELGYIEEEHEERFFYAHYYKKKIR